MINFALRIPDYYKDEIEALKGDVSINQFIVNALSEKIATLRSAEYLQKRAKNGSREEALKILDSVIDREPIKGDEL